MYRHTILVLLAPTHTQIHTCGRAYIHAYTDMLLRCLDLYVHTYNEKNSLPKQHLCGRWLDLFRWDFLFDKKKTLSFSFFVRQFHNLSQISKTNYILFFALRLFAVEK